jgi:uncharacterized membrane protein YuzA (DUF378 family)
MTSKNENLMKYFDIIAAGLLVIGGLNWGLVGFIGFDLVARIFGSMSIISKVIYCLVGLAAVYEALQFRTIARRWQCRWTFREAGSSTA